MSMYNKDLPMGVEEPRTIEFAAPSASDVEVIGKDMMTNLEYYNLTSPNALLRIIENYTTASGNVFEYTFKKNGYPIRTINSHFCRRDLQGPVWASFPLNFSPGQYQIAMVQRKGTVVTTPQEIELVWQVPLVRVSR